MTTLPLLARWLLRLTDPRVREFLAGDIEELRKGVNFEAKGKSATDERAADEEDHKPEVKTGPEL